MNIDFLLDKFRDNQYNEWINWGDQTLVYKDLLHRIDKSLKFIQYNNIENGAVVCLIGDFTPNSIALILSLILNDNIIVPFATPIKENDQIKFEIAQIEWHITLDINTDEYTILCTNVIADHKFYQNIRDLQTSGLILFTSGTSGSPKAAIHNFEKLLRKFKRTKKAMKTLNFLLFDHWGGLNTLFHTLSNCGLVVVLRDRKPETVCQYIDRYKIELLPTSPSFLNLLLLSEIYKNFDLSPLKLITYGTEPMPESTLKKIKSIFPQITFLQTYGLIELGVLSSKSREDGSLWMKLGGDGYELRVSDNLLEIKAASAMLGYLNAPSPFTEDGYFKTGDMVEVDGDYFKILGRKSELINVGGEKVYPQEVENVIIQYPGIMDVTVFGEKNAILGNIVCAKVCVNKNVDPRELSKELKKLCKSKLHSYKVPVKISVEIESLFNDRYKKKRVNN